MERLFRRFASLRLFNALRTLTVRSQYKYADGTTFNISYMHYVRIKTRVRLYLHDIKVGKREKAFKLLNLRKIEYRYIPKYTCISVKLKDESIVKYIILELSK